MAMPISFDWLDTHMITYPRVSGMRKLWLSKRTGLILVCRFRPPRLPPTFWTWMMPVFTLPDEKFAACAGFDALAMTRALKLLLLMSCYVALTVLILVLPVNATGGFVDTQPLSDSEECENVNEDPTERAGVCSLCSW